MCTDSKLKTKKYNMIFIISLVVAIVMPALIYNFLSFILTVNKIGYIEPGEVKKIELTYYEDMNKEKYKEKDLIFTDSEEINLIAERINNLELESKHRRGFKRDKDDSKTVVKINIYDKNGQPIDIWKNLRIADDGTVYIDGGTFKAAGAANDYAYLKKLIDNAKR